LLLGGALAHFFGGPKTAPNSVPTAIAVLASPPPVTPAPISPSPAASAAPRPSPAPSQSASSEPTPSAPATTLPTPAASVKTVHANHVIVRTASPKTPAPSTPRPVVARPTPAPTIAVRASAAPLATPQTVAAEGPAATLVRSYLQALARGDRSAAATYLAQGTPTETFMNPQARIESIRSESTGPQQYHVTADVQTVSGEYYITFTVGEGPAGLQITDHYSIKPQ
jgi:hypothetical protein